MAEPSTSLHIWKGSIILSFILVNISAIVYTTTVLSSLLKNYRIKYKEAKPAVQTSRDIIMAVEVAGNK